MDSNSSKKNSFLFELLPRSILFSILEKLDKISLNSFSCTNKKLGQFTKQLSYYKNSNETNYKKLNFSLTENLKQHETMKWKLNQVFGEDPTAVNEENVITTVEFDPSGEFLSIGYQCGQVVVFRNQTGDTFKFYTQFESHTSEFDFLTSLEIEEKINKIRWVKNKYRNNSRLLLTTNDKTIKLWKMFERKGQDASAPPAEVVQRKVFPNAHAYNINSISLCSDGELFISTDDLRVNLWNLENGKECFTIVDCKPSNMNELNEVITAADFHPYYAHSFMYASSKGVVKMADMRHQALCDNQAKFYTDKKEKKSFFSEVIGSVSDVKFSSDGRYILGRDYLKLKIWDVNMESEPVKVIDVHDHVKSKLYELYENDGLFDKFECALSPTNSHAVTGSYSNNFAIVDCGSSEVKYTQAINPRERRKKKSDTLNFNEKILHVAWHPTSNLTAIAAQNYIYLYHLAKP